MQNPPNDIDRPKLFRAVAAQLIFWGWNTFFLMVSAFGILPLILSAPDDLVARAFSADLLARLAVLLLLPALCIVGAFIALRRQPKKLLQLFYGVETPLLLLMMVRTFGLDSWSTGGWHVLITAVVATLGLSLQLARGYPKWKIVLHALLVARTVGLMMALWTAALVAVFFVPPVFEALRHVDYRFFMALPLIATFVLITGPILIGAPLGLIWAHAAGYRRLLKYHGLRARFTFAIVAGAATVWLGAVAWCNRQQPLDTNKATLLNAYLAPDRYLTGTTDNPLKDRLGAPFIYGGNMYEDVRRARELYEQTYDLPIEKAERETIAPIKAHEKLWSWNRQSDVLDIDAKRVRLMRQEITLHERGDFADIEIHDLYENNTALDQEIFYYFTLPEDAAVTGLWLGANDNRAERFAGVLAPRGAAQAVYRAEVTQRIDPALIEQLGPTQYRLRAYPVPARGRLHMWMTYTAARTGADWPRPHVLEKRNAYWNDSTTYLRHGEAVVRSESDAWVPNELPAGAKVGEPIQTAVLPDKTVIERERFEAQPDRLPQGKRLLLIVDGSYSMHERARDVLASLDWARSNLAIHNQVDVALRGGTKPLNEVYQYDLEAKGHETLDSVLRQAPSGYDAWFVLTDDSGVDGDAPAYAPPLWIVTLGGKPAQQYSDATQKILARRGSGTTQSLERATYRMAAMLADPSVIAVTDTSIWRAKKVSAVAPETITPLARVAIKHAVAARDDLRAAHALAQQGQVVTPYSSLIVLIDERQREALRLASAASDAFEREVESGLPQQNFAVNATPEPETWAMLILACALVVLALRQRKMLASMA